MNNLVYIWYVVIMSDSWMGDKFFFCFFIVLNFIYILSIIYILNFIVYDFVNVINKLVFYYDDDKKL